METNQTPAVEIEMVAIAKADFDLLVSLIPETVKAQLRASNKVPNIYPLEPVA